MAFSDYIEHCLSNDNKVVIAFAAGDQQKFQFGRSLTNMGLSHVLMRDSSRQWYQNGIKGLPSRDDIRKYIERYVINGFRVTTLGLSAGAYAALLYGQLAHAHHIVAISPVTGADKLNFHPEWHHRFMPQPGDPQILDLTEVFDVSMPHSYIDAYVTDGNDCRLDHHMAERIGLTKIHMVPGYEHDTLARGMSNNGMLARALLR